MTDRQMMLLRDAQWALENLPCGGLGVDGPSLDELTDAAMKGHPYAGEGSFHQGQTAWRLIEQALMGEP